MPGLGDICMVEAARRDLSLNSTLNSTLLVCPECNGNTLPSSDPNACDWCWGAGVLEEALVDEWHEWSAEAAAEWTSADGRCSGQYDPHGCSDERWFRTIVEGTRLAVTTYDCGDHYETDAERLNDAGVWVSMTKGIGFWSMTSLGACAHHARLRIDMRQLAERRAA